MSQDSLDELRKNKIVADLGFSREVLNRMLEYTKDPAKNVRPATVDLEVVKKTIGEVAILDGWGGGGPRSVAAAIGNEAVVNPVER